MLYAHDYARGPEWVASPPELGERRVRAPGTGYTYGVTAGRYGALDRLAATLLDVATDENRVGGALCELAAEHLGGDASFWLAREDRLVCIAATSGGSPPGTEMGPVLMQQLIRTFRPDSYVAPLHCRGRLLGVWTVHRPDAGAMTDDDRGFARAAGSLAAASFEHARRLAGVADLVTELRAEAEVLEVVSDAVVTLDGDGRVINWNLGAEALYGYRAADVVGADLFALLGSAVLVDGDELPIDRAIGDLARAGRWRGELHERHADGSPIFVRSSLTAVPRPGGPDGIIVVNRDLTDQRREEHAAAHDPLTGLPNRRALLDRLRSARVRARRKGERIAVLFLDLNGFKPINDQFGHTTGDAVLRVTGERLCQAIRGHDAVARLGGDEFVVLLERVADEADVLSVARRIAAGIAVPIEHDGRTVTVSASIGIAHAANDDGLGDGPVDELLEAADKAMYEAKAAGGGIAVHTPP
jgi:diguanylate cyclase (GGDEF)-like protein/PAS domain S-box-containing protein